MDRDEFRAELQRMVKENGIDLTNEDGVLDQLRADIEADAEFVNVFRGEDETDLLLVTSAGLAVVAETPASVDLRWRVALDQVTEVHADTRTHRDHVVDDLVVEVGDGRLTFRFGVNPTGDEAEEQRDIVRSNCLIALDEIVVAQEIHEELSSPGADDDSPATPATPADQ